MTGDSSLGVSGAASVGTDDRRAFLSKAIWGGVAGVGVATVAVAGSASPAGAAPSKLRVDVACLLDTFTYLPAPGATDPSSDFYGSWFLVEGELYPAGTIPAGAADFDPGSKTPTGHWLCRGVFVNRTGRTRPDRPEPHVLTHQEYLFGRITPAAPFPRDQLASSGLEGDNSGRSAVRSVVGGAGDFWGATGSVRQHVTGANNTTGPNFRFDFFLKY